MTEILSFFESSTNSIWVIWVIALILALEFIFGTPETRALSKANDRLDKVVEKLDNRVGQMISTLGDLVRAVVSPPGKS
jgi:hypothetical protein